MHNFIVHAVGTRNPSSDVFGELPVSHLAIALFPFPGSLKDKSCQCILKSLDRSYCGFLECSFLCWLTSIRGDCRCHI